jgi:phosphate transport system substrate-binding protein
VVVYSRDDASGTFDTFRHLVLGDAPLAPGAVRIASSDELADAVAKDEAAVGFAGLTHVRSARAVAIADGTLRPTFPTPFTVATEAYPLTRRLYLYTPDRPATLLTQSFVRFALSHEGQLVVRQAGFVDLEIKERAPERCEGACPARYARLASRARRLSLDFRFRAGSSELDSRAVRDVQRVVAYLAARPAPRLVLVGFTDRVGDRAANLQLSRERAKRVADELAAHGVAPVAIEAFGDEMPVAAGGGEDARGRNRRVELWLEVDP